MRARLRRPVLACGGLLLVVLAAAGCQRRAAPPAVTCRWIAGRPEPACDPQGPPDPLRWSLVRLLSRGLTEEDSSGAIVPAAAAGWEWSEDSLALTFRLRRGLAFPDGSPCRSADFARALAAGLGRTDHASQAWLLGAVAGVERVRAGRPLPPLGIATPDESTLVLRLRRPDPALPGRLALPGVSAPWSGAAGEGWRGAGGPGAYRVLASEAGRSLTLVRREPGAGPDTIAIRFQPLAARVLTFLRGSGADLVWPLPAGLESSSLPAGMRLRSRPASPRRVLLLVMRADLPPTSRLETRHALGHGLNRARLWDALGAGATRTGDWPPGAGPFDFPAFDEARARDWMGRGRLGTAFHVTMTYDADGAGAAVARVLQGGWSRLGIYVELRPLRGARRERELLTGLSHLALVEAQPWSDEAAGTLSQIVLPLRGPAVGAFRTGWRTRDFDGWTDPGPGRPRPDGPAMGARLAQELVALPLAGLDWAWACRDDGPDMPFHPRYGPSCVVCPAPPAGSVATAAAPGP